MGNGLINLPVLTHWLPTKFISKDIKCKIAVFAAFKSHFQNFIKIETNQEKTVKVVTKSLK